MSVRPFPKIQAVILTYGHFSEPKMEDMIRSPENENALFIYPDFLENMEKFDSDLRLYNRHGPHKLYPRSAGIPTGTISFGPYAELSDTGVTEAINCALDDIRTLIECHHYSHVFFPAVHINFQNGVRFGVRIPHPGKKLNRKRDYPYAAGWAVEDYITASLLSLETR